LAYCGNVLIENRNGIVVDTALLQCSGLAERHAAMIMTERKRKRIEEVFGWAKTVGMLRKTRHRGLETVAWVFTFTATAYNLVRMRNLIFPAVQSVSVRGELCFEFLKTRVCGPYPPTWAPPQSEPRP
jgi:Transposase DDE domain